RNLPQKTKGVRLMTLRCNYLHAGGKIKLLLSIRAGFLLLRQDLLRVFDNRVILQRIEEKYNNLLLLA
ncbi:MAG TPA: hypothetical protein VHF44_04195, partial [Nitrososphaeraceae archaeon]|nr:hypothetical protein [Nitrososphaeraceae archaeon]